MRIYVASNWRNRHQPFVVELLRADGHDVYDFRHPAPNNEGFSWKQCSTAEQLKDPQLFRDEVLKHPVAEQGFKYDMVALMNAQATVLVLPCGRSAHLELGYAVGAGQKTIVLFESMPAGIDEPELMYKMCTRLCCDMKEVREALR